MMAAYVVFCLQDVSDPDGLQRYRKLGGSTLAEHGARFVAGPQVSEDLEGGPMASCVILEFDDADSARKWYHSEAYQEAAALRRDASSGFGIIVDGRTS
jgi:uncharacterized protein (DUF1330 family)